MTLEHNIEPQPGEIDGLIGAYLLDGEGGGMGFNLTTEQEAVEQAR